VSVLGFLGVLGFMGAIEVFGFFDFGVLALWWGFGGVLVGKVWVGGAVPVFGVWLWGLWFSCFLLGGGRERGGCY